MWQQIVHTGASEEARYRNLCDWLTMITGERGREGEDENGGRREGENGDGKESEEDEGEGRYPGEEGG